MTQNVQLHVEGSNDLHTIIQLLSRHDIDCSQIGIRLNFGDETQNSGGIHTLTHRVLPRVLAQIKDESIGFVVDANGDCLSRWASIRSKLQHARIQCPESPDKDGIILQFPERAARIGVWLMPDNDNPGAIEEFIASLIPSDDKLIEHARQSTSQAQVVSAQFQNSAQQKAITHCWLAWQEKPGVPYGMALKSRYLCHDSTAAIAFVTWFKRLFEIS